MCVHHILALRNGRYNSRASPFSSTIVKPLKLVRNWKKYSYYSCTCSSTFLKIMIPAGYEFSASSTVRAGRQPLPCAYVHGCMAAGWLARPAGQPATMGAKDHTTCSSCVGAGFGWSEAKQKCGTGFANKSCDAGEGGPYLTYLLLLAVLVVAGIVVFITTRKPKAAAGAAKAVVADDDGAARKKAQQKVAEKAAAKRAVKAAEEELARASQKVKAAEAAEAADAHRSEAAARAPAEAKPAFAAAPEVALEGGVAGTNLGSNPTAAQLIAELYARRLPGPPAPPPVACSPSNRFAHSLELYNSAGAARAATAVWSRPKRAKTSNAAARFKRS